MVADSSSSAPGLLTLAHFLDRFKSVLRTGWLDRGVEPLGSESVADHSFGVALLAWVCALQRCAEGVVLDPERVLKLALIHDLAEGETGDLPPYDPAAIPDGEDTEARRAFLETRHVRDSVRDAEKRTAEDASMQRLLAQLPDTPRLEMAALWDELRLGVSPEARFVKQVDRLETFLQSRHYLGMDPTLPMTSFRQEVLETIDDPLLAAIRDEALRDDPTRSMG
jgi:putative hydrolase of HD superfamily